MKNLLAKAGVTALGSALLLTTAGAESASALFIEAAETFTVSEDVCYRPYAPLDNSCLGTGVSDRQFRSYNGDNPLTLNGKYTPDDSLIPALEGYPFNGGGDVRNMAVVGSFTAEEMRGLVEFNLGAYYARFAALDAMVGQPKNSGGTELWTQAEADEIKAKLIASAAMSFRVFQLGGLHPDNQNPLGTGDNLGDIRVLFYQGNGKEDLSDYGDGTSKSTGDPIDVSPDAQPLEGEPFILPFDPPIIIPMDYTFSTRDLVKGDRVSVGISQAVAHALDLGWEYLGFRLEAMPFAADTNPLGACAYDSGNPNNPDFAKCGAIAFSDFTIGAVPTPAVILPSLFGLAMGAIRKQRKDETESEMTES